MEETKPVKSGQPSPVPSSRKPLALSSMLFGVIFLVAAILLLLVFAYNQQSKEADSERKRLVTLKATNNARRREVTAKEAQVEREAIILKSVAEGKTKASPDGDARFEIGFGRIPLSLYLEIASQTAADSEGSQVVASLHATKNDLADAIKRNVRALVPELANIQFAPNRPQLEQSAAEIRSLQKAGLIKLREQSVTCLFIRQIGKGNADEVTLLGEQCALKGVYDLFDDTDISWSFYHTHMAADELSSRQKIGAFSSRQWLLGSLPHHKGLLVPLYVSSGYSAPKTERNTSTMQFVKGMMLIPERLKYRNRRTGATVEIELEEYLKHPVEIAGQFSTGGE